MIEVRLVPERQQVTAAVAFHQKFRRGWSRTPPEVEDLGCHQPAAIAGPADAPAPLEVVVVKAQAGVHAAGMLHDLYLKEL